jgi:hypothetical protein
MKIVIAVLFERPTSQCLPDLPAKNQSNLDSTNIYFYPIILTQVYLQTSKCKKRLIAKQDGTIQGGRAMQGG